MPKPNRPENAKSIAPGATVAMPMSPGWTLRREPSVTSTRTPAVALLAISGSGRLRRSRLEDQAARERGDADHHRDPQRGVIGRPSPLTDNGSGPGESE